MITRFWRFFEHVAFVWWFKVVRATPVDQTNNLSEWWVSIVCLWVSWTSPLGSDQKHALCFCSGLYRSAQTRLRNLQFRLIPSGIARAAGDHSSLPEITRHSTTFQVHHSPYCDTANQFKICIFPISDAICTIFRVF